MACGVVMAREPAGRRVGGEVASSTRTQLKRARDSLEGKTTTGGRDGSAAGVVSVVAHTPGQRRLQERMKAELDAVRALHRKAVLLCRGGGAGAAPAAKGDARLSGAEPRREAAAAAAKRRRANPSEESATEAAAQQKKGQLKQQQQAPAPRPAPPPSAKEDAQKKKREMEEMARAREEFRRLVLAMEKATLPDETVYRHELQELGIAPFEYAVTRTRRQALSQDKILVGVAY